MIAAIVLALMTTVCTTHAYATHDLECKRPERPDGGTGIEKKKKPKKTVACKSGHVRYANGYVVYGKKK